VCVMEKEESEKGAEKIFETTFTEMSPNQC
jgi:hypothetical protein